MDENGVITISPESPVEAFALRRYDTETLPLFPLTMIMEAEGVLARDMAERLAQEGGA